MEWTKEQQLAIKEKGTNILVAAGAGSGKTAVLVERIINKIINEKMDIDKILVVTFTNAAASEMRERVLKAIYKELENDSNNTHLQRQITLLNKANICTIDSFCLDVLRNNFYEIDGLAPNFRIADTTEIELIKQEALEDLFERKYEEKDEDFETLLTTYTTYRDDTPLKDTIMKIDTYIQSMPFPIEWLDEKIEMFNLEGKLNQDFSKTIWGEIILKKIKEMLSEDLIKLQEARNLLLKDDELEIHKKVIEDDIDKLEELLKNNESWDNSYEVYSEIKDNFIDWPKKKIESELKDKAKKIRDMVRKHYTTKEAIIQKIMFCNSEEANEDIYKMYHILKKLENIIIEYQNEFKNKKIKKNILDFNDMEHYALQILLHKNEKGEIEKTEIAKKYEKKFEEIAIDEYQDSNLVQEYILTSISNNKNVFMVGDVKQSIYKFRQAMPDLFLDKYERYKLKEDMKENDELKIQLFKNFRSRKQVLNITNTIFENIMSSELENVNYTKEEFLNCGANYQDDKENLIAELHVITNDEEDADSEINNFDEISDEDQEEKFEDIEVEAKFVAKKIRELIDSKYQIYDMKNEKYRDIQYRDIAILLRSTKSTSAIYEQELLKLNVPTFSDTSNQYLDSIEINTIMSLLMIIDNPIQDIPLISVLRSNIGGFTDNELIDIRLVDKSDNFYNCLLKAKIQVDEKLRNKIESFINNLNMWRKETSYLSLDEFIWKLCNDTGFYNFVGLMPNGEMRQANLKLLFEKAHKYESSNFKGVYGFVKFIERLKLNSGDLSSAKIIGENDNVVRIMSIHKSKGLEFPIVFLSSTGRKFNLMDLNNDILLHQKMGLGVKYIDYNRQVEYNTLTKLAIKEKILAENIAEEMRILYVALTRAKEKLIITGIQNQYLDKMKIKEEEVQTYKKLDDKINSGLIKKYRTYLDWMLLINKYENMEDILKVNIITKNEIMKDCKKDDNDEKIDIIQKLSNYKINLKEYENLEKIISYEYPYKLATTIPTKTSVSNIKKIESEYVAELFEEKNNVKELPKPLFIKPNNTSISNAQKGTIMHLVLQKLNLKENYDEGKIESIINQLVDKGILLEQEAKTINKAKILEFTKSEIWKEVQDAKVVEREKGFYINIPAKEIYNEECEEKILVQGVIDLFYIKENGDIVLVDYKTDYVENEIDLVEKYNKQLSLYKRALEEIYHRKISKTYIYSIYLGKSLEI